MDDLCLTRVLRKCRSLGEVIGATIALAPLPNNKQFQLMSIIHPETGITLSEPRNILNSPCHLEQVEAYLIRMIRLANLRAQARVDIQQIGA